METFISKDGKELQKCCNYCIHIINEGLEDVDYYLCIETNSSQSNIYFHVCDKFEPRPWI